MAQGHQKKPCQHDQSRTGRCQPGVSGPFQTTSTERVDGHGFEFSAVAKIGPRWFAGFIAWLIVVLHLAYLIGFKTKITSAVVDGDFLSTRRLADHHRPAGICANALRQLAELAAEAQGSAASAKVASWRWPGSRSACQVPVFRHRQRPRSTVRRWRR